MVFENFTNIPFRIIKSLERVFRIEVEHLEFMLIQALIFCINAILIMIGLI